MRAVTVPTKVLIDINEDINNCNYFSLGEVVKRKVFAEDNEEMTIKIR